MGHKLYSSPTTHEDLEERVERERAAVVRRVRDHRDGVHVLLATGLLRQMLSSVLQLGLTPLFTRVILQRSKHKTPIDMKTAAVSV
jgi:hypothetical protein